VQRNPVGDFSGLIDLWAHGQNRKRLVVAAYVVFSVAFFFEVSPLVHETSNQSLQPAGRSDE
jgi:hypothetical protein